MNQRHSGKRVRTTTTTAPSVQSANSPQANVPTAKQARTTHDTRNLTAMPLLRGAYSPEHAAAYLDISRAALYRLMASGALRGYRQGRLRRFLRSELDAFLAAQVAAGDGDDADGGGWDDAAS